MTFRLIVTPPPKVGEEYTHEQEFANREAAAMAALRILSGAHAYARLAGGLVFGEQIAQAPLGKTVPHYSGYIFRTEEV